MESWPKDDREADDTLSSQQSLLRGQQSRINLVEIGMKTPSLVTVALSISISLLLRSASAMRLVVQRCKSASVTVQQEKVSSIGPGILALVGLHQDDTVEDLQYCAKVG